MSAAVLGTAEKAPVKATMIVRRGLFMIASI
jgi:hypothetical protein